MHDIHSNLAENIRQLRLARGLSQERMSQLSGIPRPTWASLESGAANPTLAVLSKAALSLKVSIEELLSAPRAEGRLYRAADIKETMRQGTRTRPLLPEAIPGLEISRMNIKPGGHMVGLPHTPGTREYLTCERGCVELTVAGRKWKLDEGDTLVFRGDQPHGYRNPDPEASTVAFSVVCFATG